MRASHGGEQHAQESTAGTAFEKIVKALAEGPCSSQELQSETELGSRAVNMALYRAEKRGEVERGRLVPVREPGKRRARLWSLTGKGVGKYGS